MDAPGLISAAALGLLTATTGVSWSQTTPPAVAASSVRSVPPVNAKGTTLGQIAQQLTKGSGIAVVTDSSLLSAPVTFTSLGGALDAVLTQLTPALPPGVTIRAALVPDTGVAPDGDAVAALLKAQDAFAAKPSVSGAKGAAVSSSAPTVPTRPTFTPGKFDLLGQQVTLDEAATKIADLHLRPVYVIVRNRPAVDPVAKMTAMQAEAMKAWSSMTPDQQKQAMQIQFNAMMNGTPADRQAMIGQMAQQGAAIMGMMQQMPPDQQKQIQQEFMNALGQNGMMPPPGGGSGRRQPSAAVTSVIVEEAPWVEDRETDGYRKRIDVDRTA